MEATMGKGKRVLFLAMVSAALYAAGCETEDLQQVDRIVYDVNDAFSGAAEIADGTAGRLIPEPWRTALALLGFLGPAAIAIWEKIRASKILEKNAELTLTTRAIVQGVEAADEPHKGEVKGLIGERMRAMRVYDTGDQIVEGLKKGA
jgi:hypothetical protein